MLVHFYQTTLYNIPKDIHLHTRNCGNLNLLIGTIWVGDEQCWQKLVKTIFASTSSALITGLQIDLFHQIIISSSITIMPQFLHTVCSICNPVVLFWNYIYFRYIFACKCIQPGDGNQLINRRQFKKMYFFRIKYRKQHIGSFLCILYLMNWIKN